VELTLTYALAHPSLDALTGSVFDHIAASMVDAFVSRAEVVYG
jgi:ribosome-associated toxin RatA of RatAB toxin-antitoxin module